MSTFPDKPGIPLCFEYFDVSGCQQKTFETYLRYSQEQNGNKIPIHAATYADIGMVPLSSFFLPTHLECKNIVLCFQILSLYTRIDGWMLLGGKKKKKKKKKKKERKKKKKKGHYVF